jgi:enterobacteria phage integrase
VRIAHHGCTAIEIMSVSGHKTLAEAQKYVTAVEQKRMAEAAMVKRAAGSNRAQAVTETGKSHD